MKSSIYLRVNDSGVKSLNSPLQFSSSQTRTHVLCVSIEEALFINQSGILTHCPGSSADQALSPATLN